MRRARVASASVASPTVGPRRVRRVDERPIFRSRPALELPLAPDGFVYVSKRLCMNEPVRPVPRREAVRVHAALVLSHPCRQLAGHPHKQHRRAGVGQDVDPVRFVSHSGEEVDGCPKRAGGSGGSAPKVASSAPPPLQTERHPHTHVILSERSESKDLSRAQRWSRAGDGLCNPEILRLRAAPSAQDDRNEGRCKRGLSGGFTFRVFR